MWPDLKSFMAERAPLPAVLPLAAVLYGAPALLGDSGLLVMLRGVLSTLCALVMLRAVDDLSDLAEDRRCHPRRGLVSGRIRPVELMKAAALLGVLVAAINVVPPGSIYVGIVMGAYLVFYCLKKSLHPAWQPLWVNLIFAAVPFYAAGWSLNALLLALFVWLAVVGHDYCHSVHGPDDGCRARETPSTRWGSRGAALAGMGAYGLSAAAGAAFWMGAGRPLLFCLPLAASVLGLAVLGSALIIKPCRSRARAFYVPGFLFFLLPLAGFIIHRLIP